MRQKIARDAENYMKNHKRKGRWYKLVTGLACVVVFCTTYALILPAITLEGNQCDIPEHTHTDACYTQVTFITRKVPICTEDSLNIHQHTKDCLDSDGNLVCGYADYVAHKHDASCYREDGSLWCPLEELEPHVHDDSCYYWPEPHVHTDECYTLERGELICTEHVHTDDCYTETTGLTCGLAESEGHHHDDSCYDGDGNLICSQEESEGHHHDDSCYGTVRELTCDIDSNHQHTDACYELEKVLTCELSTDPVTEPVLDCDKPEIILHTHTENCYDKYGNLVCGQIEIKEHKHTAACFREEEEPVDTETLTCTTPEGEEHQHSARCYGTWELTCGMEEHTHTLACYADPEADVETEADWEQTFASVNLTGKWHEDLLNLAKTQLGYTESEHNYIVLEDGETTKGYTRYGVWQDDPYMDWNAAFASFCLHYAGVTEFPTAADCESWPGALGEQYAPAGSHEPAPGDLVFFDQDSNGKADQVGILLEVTEGTEEEPAVLTTIEGDAENAVRKVPHSAEEVLGYGVVPDQAKTFTLTGQTESGIIVTVTGDSTSLPCLAGDVTVVVRELDENERQEIEAQLAENEERKESEVRYLLDISLRRSENEIEPVGPVNVTLSGLDAEGLYPKVSHIDTETNVITDVKAVKDEDGNISMEADHFSVWVFDFDKGNGLSGNISASDFSDGNSFYLTADAYITDTVYVNNRSITLDLNGFGIYYKGTSNLFEVQSGGSLTIGNSGAVDETVTSDSGNKYGRAAQLDKNGSKPTKLTYYVTESNAAGIETTETLKKHEVTPKGFISAETNGAQSIVKVTGGGTFTLEGGLLTNPYKRIIDNDHSTVTISGGYITGGNVDGDTLGGGGIYSSGTLNMTGGVIAANQASNRGGGVTLNGGTFNLSGGVISGNWTWNGVVGKVDYSTGEGGGIYSNGATLNLSGTAYVTNNRQNKWCAEAGRGTGCHGGGGIATDGGTLNMTGGYVTGNYSKEAGGGLYVGHWESGTTFTMSGGIVAGNLADTGEGGGIRISGGSHAIISASQTNKAYISHNRTESDYDWGGGGIFVQENGALQVFNSLITNNSAGGYSGGVGACPSGTASMDANNGAAIYGNTATGNHWSAGGNGKNTDSSTAKNSTIFTSNGYNDFFWVEDNDHYGTAIITGKMLGGNPAQWKGSIDKRVITDFTIDQRERANYLVGLTAHPDNDAKNSATAAASVIISGNFACNHGGGIMTNGGLVLGSDEITPPPTLNITGTKVLKVNGTPQDSGRDFQFELWDSTESEIVGTATADATTGEFSISPEEPFAKEGTYTYILKEKNDGREGVEYSSARYEIKVVIAKKNYTEEHTTYTTYYVQSVSVNGQGSGGTSTFKIHFQKPSDWSKVCLHIWNWDAYKTVWPGNEMTLDPTHGNQGWYTAEFDVTTSTPTQFSYIINWGAVTNKTADMTGEYYKGGELWLTWNGHMNQASVSTNAPDETWDTGGGDTPITGSSFTGTLNPDGSYTIALQGTTFENNKTQVASLNLKLVKNDINDTTKLLSGAEFFLKEENAGTGVTAKTDTSGVATFAGIQKGTTYWLWETKAPANYYEAGPWILKVNSDGTALLYPAKELTDGTLEINGTPTVLTVSGTDPIVLTATISDQPYGYELPDTGGAGTQMYTLGGLLLIAAAGLLAYSQRKRRKEDFASF